MSATIIGTAYLIATTTIGSTFLAADGTTTNIIPCLITGHTLSEAPANSITETNLTGNVISERRDDLTITGTVTLLVEAAATVWPKTMGRVTLASMTDTRWNVKYLIESVSAPITRGAHIQYTLTLKSNSLIAA